mgnify:CR=1 FL=1
MDGTVYNAAVAAQSLYLGRVIRIIRGVQEKRQFGRLEVHWLAYHGCGYTPLQESIKAESARYLETFLSEKRWNDAEALLADSLVSASTFDKILSEFWHPEKTAPAWNYYILMHRSERALDLLKKHCSYSLPNIIKSGDAKTMSVMIEHGWITRDNINTMIQLAIDHKAVEVQSQLLNYKMKKGMDTDPAEDLLL